MFASIKTISPALLFLAGSSLVYAEKHTVHLVNKCGHGTPTLIEGGKIISTGKDYTSKGPFQAAIAYLQTGNCGFDGGRCTTVEITLKNPTTPGSGSSVDISMIPPLAFGVASSFVYKNGCDGAGARCGDKNCPNAFRKPDDNHVQVQCQKNDVDLVVTFC